MGTQTAIVAEAQGAEAKKVRTPSASYTVKALGENIKKLEGMGYLVGEELTQIKELHLKVAMKLLGV